MNKILGSSDEVTTCECCGKMNLKKTVVIDNGSGIIHFGVNCAAKVTGMKSAAIDTEANVKDTISEMKSNGFSDEQIEKKLFQKFGWAKRIKFM